MFPNNIAGVLATARGEAGLLRCVSRHSLPPCDADFFPCFLPSAWHMC